MGVQYIPPSDADFMLWIDNFSALISADPTSFGLTGGDATALAALTTAYDDALIAATNNTTRTPVIVNVKDTARAAAEERARQLSIIIQSNPSITEAQKLALRITVRKSNRTPVPPPTTSPLLTFTAATPLQHTLRYSDQLTPDSRGRPFGASALMLSVWVRPAGTAPTGPADQTLTITRNPAEVNFTPGDVTKMATYIARWVTLKGELGPVSAPLTVAVV